jgi:competence protein ComEC
VREERERSDRIVVRAHRVEGERLAQTLVRVRVAVRKGTAPAVGAFVEMRALGAAARSLASGRANTRP